MNDLTPVTREEIFLAKLGGQDVETPSPVTREELYLDILCGNSANVPAPFAREEIYLASLCGKNVQIPEPVTRKETFLAALCGEGILPPNPVTREEFFLADWLNNNGEFLTVTGAIATFTTLRAAPLRSLAVTMGPKQDLHGYANPWPAGGGKNLFDKSNIVANTRIGTAGGEISANDYFTTTYISVVVGTSYTKNSPDVNAYHRFCTYSSTNEFVRKVDNSNTITIEEGESYLRFCGLNTELDTTQLEIGTSSTTFAPYSNICPISGWTGANVYHSGADTSDATTYSITFPSEAGTVYGGTLDVTTGLLTVTYGNIASYSGETLPGRWISSMDVYSAGGTPTTGAQVVYELATPQTYQLTPTEVTALIGDNTIWADAGDVTVTYRSN